mgnify:CR=1 FL=1
MADGYILPQKKKRLQVYISNLEYNYLAEALDTAYNTFVELSSECDCPVGKQRLSNIAKAIYTLNQKIYPEFEIDREVTS